MLISLLTMQNAMIVRNSAMADSFAPSGRMINSIGFGNSQPLKPNFASITNDELIIKANETKVSALKKLLLSLKDMNTYKS